MEKVPGEMSGGETEEASVDVAEYGPALNQIRWRRQLFFGVVLIYVPAVWVIHGISPTNKTMFTTIGIWVVLLLITCLMSASARCPRCGNYFHVHGMSMLYLRRCLHCQLHINADKGK